MVKFHGLSLCLVLCLGSGCTRDKAGEPTPNGAAPAVERTANQTPTSLDAPSPEQSAGLFIGAEEFQHESNNPPYTVNDAVDLAHSLIKNKLLLVNQVHILLSGQPDGASVKRYEELKGDALIGTATKFEIESVLKTLAASVGPKGVLYVFFATHGYSDGVKHFLMAQDSLSQSLDTAVSVEWILEATRSTKGQVVLILDTCRVRNALSSDPHRTGKDKLSGSVDSRSGVPWRLTDDGLPTTTKNRPGYAILFATGPDQIAGPDRQRLNGVFTGAILDGLRCVDANDQQIISLFSLAAFVQKEVRTRSRGAQDAELLMAQGFRDLVMVRCCVTDILEPKDRELVIPSDIVLLRVCEPDLYAKAVIQAESNGVFYHQHPEMDFRSVLDKELLLPVAYGRPDNFQVYVGLGEDPEFLDREDQIPRRPETDRNGRPIRWLGPVRVTLPSKSSK